jgi:integrase
LRLSTSSSTLATHRKNAAFFSFGDAISLGSRGYLFNIARIAEIKRAEVQDFIRAKTATLSAGYVRLNLVATLRAILQPYVADDRLPRNAASGSPAFKYPSSSKAPKKLNGSITTKKYSDGRTLVDGGRALTRDEVALLLTHSSPQYWTVLLTMVYTGMRLGEVLAMQWEYLTEGDDGVGLYAVEYNVDRRGQLCDVKTRSPRAEIALSSVVVEALREHRARVAAAKLMAGNDWTDHDLIFPRIGRCLHWGNPQAQSPLRKGLGRASRRAGIGHICPHDLRHTCASLLIAEGLNIKQVSSHLRHSSVEITLDTYGHLYPTDRNEVAHAMNRVLGVAKMAKIGPLERFNRSRPLLICYRIVNIALIHHRTAICRMAPP